MEGTRKSLPIWILPQLWGLDVPVAVLFWSLVCAAHMRIIMVSEGPILVVVTTVWVCTVCSRIYRAVIFKTGWYHHYYETRAVPMLLIATGAAFATVWMLVYYVGRHVLDFALVPGMFVLLALMCRNSQWGLFKLLFKALALGFSCMVPAFSLSFMAEPGQMLTFPPCWYLGILFFLFLSEKERWQHENAPCTGISNLLVVGLLMLLIVNAVASVSSPYPEVRSLFITIVVAAACLMILAKMQGDFSRHVLFAISWALMALPPLLGLLLFPPDYWGSCASIY